MKKYKADLLLLTALLAIGIALAAVLFLNRSNGETVQVRVSGQVVAEFSLKENVTYEIAGADGGRNLLIIRDCSAWIEEADCPDELCRQMGKIHLTGQSIVCLPHQVVVEVVATDRTDDELDAVVG